MHVLLWNRIKNEFWVGTAESAVASSLSQYKNRDKLEEMIQEKPEIAEGLHWIFMGTARSFEEIMDLKRKIENGEA